ncbi:MAG: aldehyde dehydrogenase [Mycetocola sp.]
MMTGQFRSEISLRAPGRILIGADWIEPTGPTVDLVDPATEEPLYSLALAGTAEVDLAVRAARAAFDRGPWPTMTPAERAVILRRFAELIRVRAGDYAALWTSQTGVPLALSQGAAAPSVDLIQYYAALAESYEFAQVRAVGPHAISKAAIVASEPVGVVAAITPWNGPLQGMLMKLAPALAAGCTVIMKPASETPLECFLLAEAAEDAGFPPGVVNLLPADRDVSDLLIRHEGVDKVSFTGSTAAGLHIASVVGARLGRYTMELGGKSAAIVLEDYDAAVLAPTLARIVTRNSGQVCLNFSRVLVPKNKHDEYVEALGDAMGAVKVGDPWDLETQMGPLAFRQHYERVFGFINRGRASGAQLVTGGQRPVGLECGYFVEPTLFANATNDMEISQQEIFGPVATVIPYDDIDDAIAIANDSDYGLSGAVFTNDTDAAYRIARRVRTGGVTQNGRDLDTRNPFGGFKKSGVGREGGPEGFEEYLEKKSIFLPALPTELM